MNFIQQKDALFIESITFMHHFIQVKNIESTLFTFCSFTRTFHFNHYCSVKLSSGDLLHTHLYWMDALFPPSI
jgi:hypothetical protein